MTERALVPVSDPVELLPPLEDLTEDERRYASKARAANTIRGYRSDWKEWCVWCAHSGFDPLPAPAAGVSRYLTALAGYGTKVGTMTKARRKKKLSEHSSGAFRTPSVEVSSPTPNATATER